MVIWPAIAATFSLAFTVSGAVPGFSFITASPNALRTTHAIRLQIARPRASGSAGPISRSTLHSTHPYQVTLGGFIGRDRAILLHAERGARCGHIPILENQHDIMSSQVDITRDSCKVSFT